LLALHKLEILVQVNNLLTCARIRFHNAREEREQFDEASNEILALLKTKVQVYFMPRLTSS